MELEQVVAHGRAAFPGIGVNAAAFSAFMAGLGFQPPFSDELHLDDLVLAHACLDGDPVALKTLDTQLAQLKPALSSFRDPDELLQRVRQRLLVAQGGPPKLAAYGGRGSLVKWARVVALRVAMSAQEDEGRHDSDDDLLERPDPSDSPELKLLKERHAKDFSAAFKEAVGALSPKEKNVLRLSSLDRMSIDEIAQLYGTHRSTVARWIAAAKDSVATATRRVLAQKLGLPQSQVDSLMTAVVSQLDVSLNALLRD
ncbi:MAG: sigma-70 family RNA polymerase sigma factor [Myxococcaceae bacterium]